MELAFARWFEPWGGWTILLASGLGGLAGLTVNLILRNLNDAGLVRFLVVLGLATGAVMGFLIVAAARRGAARWQWQKAACVCCSCTGTAPDNRCASGQHTGRNWRPLAHLAQEPGGV